MDDALKAYDAGRADGIAGLSDAARAEHPVTGADYRTGVVDGQVAVFETELLAAIRRAFGPGEDQPQDDRSAGDQPEEDRSAKDRSARDQPEEDRSAKDRSEKDRTPQDRAGKDQTRQDGTEKDQTRQDRAGKDRALGNEGDR